MTEIFVHEITFIPWEKRGIGLTEIKANFTSKKERLDLDDQLEIQNEIMKLFNESDLKINQKVLMTGYRND